MKAPLLSPPTSAVHRFFMACLGLFIYFALAAPAVHAQTWMVSTTAYVKLGVSDKYNSLGGYKASFIVTGEREDQVYYLEQDAAAGENSIDVLFPSEPSAANYFKNTKGLAATPAPGRYTWECRVKGKRVVGGHFTYPEAGNDISVVTK